MTDTADLQFERAQFDDGPAQPACALCDEPLFGAYFELNGEAVCEKCTFKARESDASGSGAGRALRATAAGAGAALGGCILYWAILAMSGYEFALIAIVVGFGVGKAVHWGSRGRGGWRYQALAVALTYLAIVGAYVPLIIAEIIKQPTEQADAVESGAAPASASDAGEGSADVDGATLLLAMGVVLGIAIASPFLAGMENIVGLVIIGIGLYEAWKLNRHQPLVITGPHVLASRPPAALTT